jgi:hypothetical protein
MVSKRQSDIHSDFARKAAVVPVKPRGRSVAIPLEAVEAALDRLANGDTMKNVTADLGVTRNALLKRATVDEDFSIQLRAAMEIGTFAMLENAFDAISGGECSTGDVRRDAEIANFAKWYASRMARNHFGDRVQVDQRQVVVTITKDDADW